MRWPVLVLALLPALLAGCAGDRGSASPTPLFRQAPDKAAGPTPPPERGRSHRFDVRELTDGFGAATAIAARPGDPGYLHVAEQTGDVRRVRLSDGRIDPKPVLSVRSRTRAGGELGLLGLAFHPDGSRAYLHYTTPAFDTRVIEVDLATGDQRVLLRVDQPSDYDNHKGGQLAFGPDGALHLALGDGGSAFDPGNRSQDPEQPFGKLLRWDGRRWRPVALGLRNPWRFSFDRETGRLWIGDVGQDRLEEIDAVDLRPGGPLPNFGWGAYEGHLPVGRKPLRDTGTLTWPIASYDHDTGCSVTGGVVYRGTKIPALRGRYVFSDFCRGTTWTIDAARPAQAPDLRREQAKLLQVTAFGEDDRGEIHAVTAGGRLVSLVAPR